MRTMYLIVAFVLVQIGDRKTAARVSSASLNLGMSSLNALRDAN